MNVLRAGGVRACSKCSKDDWEASFDGLLEGGDGGLLEALAYLLSESLGLLGHLSGGILTPSLRALPSRRPARQHKPR